MLNRDDNDRNAAAGDDDDSGSFRFIVRMSFCFHTFKNLHKQQRNSQAMHQGCVFAAQVIAMNVLVVNVFAVNLMVVDCLICACLLIDTF